MDTKTPKAGWVVQIPSEDVTLILRALGEQQAWAQSLDAAALWREEGAE